MKRLFFAVVALAMVATSCSKDESVAPEATAKTKTFTFTVKAPVMQTRATTFAAGDGLTADKLYYAFYDEAGLVAGISKTNGMSWTNNAVTIGETFEVALVEGKVYTAIFWAQNDASGYTVSMPAALADAQVAMNYGTEVANSENYDAFWKVEVVDTKTASTQHDIALVRPFAQLNIGVTTANIEVASKAGLDVASVKAVVGGVPTTFKLADGAVAGEVPVTFNWVAKGTETIDLGDTPTEYTIYSTNYVLVGAPGSAEKNLASVTFELSEVAAASAEGVAHNLDRDFGNAVPVQANHRTFIVGDILTGSAATHTYVVKIAPDFENTDKVVKDDGIVVNP